MKGRRRKQQPALAEPAPADDTAEDDTLPRPPVAWGNVIRDTLSVGNPAKLAERLRAELELGDDRTDYGSVLKAVDQSSRNFLDAVRLARAAQIEDEKFATDCEERLEVLRSQARDELVQEKGERKTGAITKQMIEDRILANWPEQYRQIKARMSRMHGARRTLDALVDSWNHRCIHLGKMLDKASIGRVTAGGIK